MRLFVCCSSKPVGLPRIVRPTPRSKKIEEFYALGIGINIPGAADISISVTGVDCEDPYPKQLLELHMEALLECFRRARALDLKDFTVNIDFDTRLIDKSNKRYQDLRQRIERIKNDLGAQIMYRASGSEAKTDAGAIKAKEMADRAMEHVYNLRSHFPSSWQNTHFDERIRSQRFLPALGETKQFLERTLRWLPECNYADAHICPLDLYRDVGIPIVNEEDQKPEN